jgi:hypothetical protein
VLGGVAAWRASSVVSLPTAILLLATINFLCALAVLAIPPRSHSIVPAPPPLEPRPSGEGDPASALVLLRKMPFLRDLALLVGVGAIISSLLDYILGVHAVARYGKGPELFWFFSVFNLVVSVISFILQVSVGRVALEKVALSVHIAVLPGVVLIGGALGLAIPGLISASFLRGTEMVHRNTLFRSAYELLYTPISEVQKRATKAVIDVGFDRAGTIVGSLATMTVIYGASANQTLMLGLVVGLAVLTLPLVRRLHAGYVAALEERLLAGAAALEVASEEAAPPSVDPDDPAREHLIRRAEQLHGQDATGPLEQAIEHPGEILDLSRELLSRSPARARAALAKLDVGTRAAAGCAMLLLAHRDLHRDARAALRRLAPHLTGQLLDLLLDPSTDFVVRRRIPPIVAAAGTQRAADGLVLALFDVRFEVRYAVGRTLLRMIRQPEIVVPYDRILAAVLAEASREEEVAAVIDDESLEGEAPLDIVIQDRVTRGLEHLFTLLSMLVDREGVRLCFRALHQEDDRFRGAALEYLQTVLPAEVRQAIWPLLGEKTGPLPSPRPAAEVLADLTKAIRLTDAKVPGSALRPATQA